MPLDLLVATVSLVCAGACIIAAAGATNIAFLSVGIALLAILLVGLLVMPRFVYQRQPTLKLAYSLTFSDADIHFRTSTIDARLQWPIYERWEEHPEFYFLFHGKRDVSVIPRRAFVSQAEDEAFRSLLTRKIGQSSRG